MGLTYNTFTTSVANFLVLPVADPNFVLALPNIIDEAEQRIYRELDLLATIVRDTGPVVAGNRNFNLPTNTGTFVVVENINIITPAGTTDPDLGTRNPVLPSTKELCDMLFPNSTSSSVPQYFGMVTQGSLVFAPWPDAAYTVEVVGTQRPAPLSAGNQTTFLSVNLPDLLLNAALVMGAGYLKNFGAAVDDPQSGLSWEALYKKSFDSANVEEIRKKFGSQGWSSKQPDPIATPPRT